jgi:hypothetical protein
MSEQCAFCDYVSTNDHDLLAHAKNQHPEKLRRPVAERGEVVSAPEPNPVGKFFVDCLYTKDQKEIVPTKHDARCATIDSPEAKCSCGVDGGARELEQAAQAIPEQYLKSRPSLEFPEN